MKTIRVAVSADDPLTRMGLTDLLSAGPSSTLRLAEDRAGADILIISVEAMGAVALTRLRQAAEFGVPVILVCDGIAENELIAAVDCRVVAVLLRRTITPELLRRSLAIVSVGGGVMPPDLVGGLLKHISQLRREMTKVNATTRSGLTAREIDVLRLTADGLLVEEIADKLCYSERTVRNILQTVTRRHGLRNRSHAVAYALRSGLI